MDQNASFSIMKKQVWKQRALEVRKYRHAPSPHRVPMVFPWCPHGVIPILVSHVDKKKILKSLYLTDGTKEAFPGLALFFLRITTKPLTTANIASETFFGVLESTKGGGILEAVESLLSKVFLPALKEQTNWGTLSADANGHVIKEAFLSKLSSFIAVLANARASIADAVKLTPCTHEGLVDVTSPAEIIIAVGNPSLVEAAEEHTLIWCKEIHQILTQSEQMRKESDNVGPRAELEHWKKRTAKFDSLTTSIKAPQCRAIINILVAAKSKVLQVSNQPLPHSLSYLSTPSRHGRNWT